MRDENSLYISLCNAHKGQTMNSNRSRGISAKAGPRTKSNVAYPRQHVASAGVGAGNLNHSGFGIVACMKMK